MTTTLSQLDGTSASLTVNNTSWTTGTVITCNAIDFSASPNPLDAMFTVKFTCPNSAPTGAKVVNVYISCSEDGTNYQDHDQYSGTNNTQTSLRTPTAFTFLMAIPVNQSIAGVGVLVSLLQILGQMPRKGGIILENQSGQTLTGPAVTWSPENELST